MKTYFDEAYEKLNSAQKKAVDAIEGPVMVVAGPGTGKTQVLALRIANILKKTDTLPSSILCLTFTRSGVTAMRARLESYIGTTARDIKISTFHGFAIDLVQKHFNLLGFDHIPELLDDNQSVAMVDSLLQEGEWEYIRPRTDPAKYFGDLKQLISLMKRERLSPDAFSAEVDRDIEFLKNDPDSISSRGPSKGQLKKEIEKKIESLSRTKEVVSFYRQYETAKKEANLMDYDDALEYVVQLVEEYEDVRADIYENYQYVLVDEHQDSSLVQNNFLKAVWQGIELPNIFVVGDDRQLIYGFSGASLDYFSEFRHAFGKAQLITLQENYRSTAPVLSLADTLLKSSITTDALKSNRAGEDKICLSQYRFSRDEIIGAGIYFKKQIDQGVSPDECALLLPKNYQVRSAVSMLRDMGLPAQSETNVSLYTLPEAKSFIRILGILANPDDSVLIAESLLDATSGIDPMSAYKFLRLTKKSDKITVEDLIQYQKEAGMFQDQDPVVKWGTDLANWINKLTHETIPCTVSTLGNELLIDRSHGHKALLRSIEVVRSLILSSEAWYAKHPNGTLKEFIAYLGRLATYGTQLSVAAFAAESGIRVMTLHKSKGLEYEHVWIGHMNEEVVMSEKRSAFTLPEKIEERISARDVMTAKRELYVALTRAKKYATISYALSSDSGSDITLSRIVEELPVEHFAKTGAEENEKLIMENDPRLYALKPTIPPEEDIKTAVKEFVKESFAENRVSVTLLNNFFECPWKWYFRNFLKLPEVKGVSLALGSAVHVTIEHLLKENNLPSENEIKKIIMTSLQREGVLDMRDIARLGKDAWTAVSGWIETYYPTLAKDRQSERSVSYRDPQFSNLTMYGKIDLTERFPDGTMTVTDFKTGSSKTTGMIEKRDDEGRMSSYLRQLAMYSYLLEGTRKDTHVDQSRLLFLESEKGDKNALYSAHISSAEVESLIKDIADYQSLVLSGEWMDRPCTAKSYGANSECEFCKRAKVILGN
jgi:DNA helicase-2/ATP-dependent DNA helicase PcrA